MKFYLSVAVYLFLLVSTVDAFSQEIEDTLSHDNARASVAEIVTPPQSEKRQWYESLSLRGYTQIRYNGFQTNPDLRCEQCDKSWGGASGFFMRRLRLVLYGQVHDRVYVYIQPDFASSPVSDPLHFAQVRDAYFDLSLDKKREFRFRIGQSKVPFGFENMQSSQNRLALDRNDALNSAVLNERDLGVFFYWAPAHIRKRFSHLVKAGLKGSGDYGVFGLGIYNGQTANKPELNDNQHVVARLAYPFLIGDKQIIEPAIQAYTGQFVLHSRTNTESVRSIGPNEFLDRRAAASFILYPQPLGIFAEYNIGQGPEFNTSNFVIENQELRGGYVLLTYMIKYGKTGLLYPFTRYQYYDGGKKYELDARKYHVRELELGVEWSPVPNFELVTMYTISERRFEDARNPDNLQSGSLVRIQAQFNY